MLAVVTEANHTGSASGTLVIKKAAATLTLSSLSQTFDGKPHPVTVSTSPAALAVTVTYAGTTTTAPTVPGSYPVVATITDANRTGSVSGTLVIAKAAQTITFAALTSQTVGNPPLTLTATASSDLTVSYSSSNAAVATVSGSTLTIVGKGTATITAKQTGNTNFLAAPNVTRALTVVQAPIPAALPSNKSVAKALSGTLAAEAGASATAIPKLTGGTQQRLAGNSDNLGGSDPITVTTQPAAVVVGLDGVAAWISTLVPTFNPPPLSVADLPPLLAYAMNLDASSSSALLPVADVSEINGVTQLTVQYRQRKNLSGLEVVVQTSTDAVVWTELPPKAMTMLPDDDADTARYAVRVPVPASGPLLVRIAVILTAVPAE